MSTKLIRYQVLSFRSIEESDWITIGENTCLVGTNEAGKTNLLIALWKLNPANNEPIIPLADFPRHLYSKYKADKHEADIFVRAEFLLDEKVSSKVAADCSCEIEQVKITRIERRFDGKYHISLPYTKIDSYPKLSLENFINQFILELQEAEVYSKESEPLKNKILSSLNSLAELTSSSMISKETLEAYINTIECLKGEFGKKQNLPEYFNNNLLSHFYKILDSFNGKEVTTTAEIRQYILANIPKFVYYSDYGNLDSEIYLPRVIEDSKRDDLSESARAKARTLNILFNYVKLSAEEIYELGNDRKIVIKTLNYNGTEVSSEEQNLTEEEILNWAEKKKERGVLLKSASSELTKSFKKWWQQGNYIFSFEADGSHFRINVADELRPEFIELEGRSRGLQWFFSFFLVFLVETKQDHANAILLLDEPGLSLHPLAQYNLASFFKKLSEDNQLIYTSHSPFLVDMDNLENVKAVYVDKNSGRTKVSSNLRYDESEASNSIYPIHAALGLTVSNTLLLGCIPILVEDESDQIYLSMIKRYLVGKTKISSNKELVFIPTGGTKGILPITRLVSAKENDLPYVLFDSDSRGQLFVEELKEGIYNNEQGKVLSVSQFLNSENAEIEDLLPSKEFAEILDRRFRGKSYFEDYYKSGLPIISQFKIWASENEIILSENWKTDLATTVVNLFDRIMKDIPEDLEIKWVSIFNKIIK